MGRTIDWDNADFHLRQALEGQLILDMSSPDFNILGKHKKDWRENTLFPRFSEGKTLSKDNFINADGTYNTSNLRSFINGKKTRDGQFKDHRGDDGALHPFGGGVSRSIVSHLDGSHGGLSWSHSADFHDVAGLDGLGEWVVEGCRDS